jgi:hypothetical protein
MRWEGFGFGSGRGDREKTTATCDSLQRDSLNERSSSSRLEQVSQSDDKDRRREAYKGERKATGVRVMRQIAGAVADDTREEEENGCERKES